MFYVYLLCRSLLQVILTLTKKLLRIGFSVSNVIIINVLPVGYLSIAESYSVV